MMMKVFLFLFIFLFMVFSGSFFGLLLCLECLSLVFIFGLSVYLSYSGFLFCLSFIVLSALSGLVILVSNVVFFSGTSVSSFVG